MKRKINRHGEYQPFYGYTIVAMVDPSLVMVSERIEQFLRESSFAESYSPLPAHTYHMTIFSIYQCGNQMIPPVERWANATGSSVSKGSWLPDEVLREQNEKAMCIIDKYLNEPLRIKYANLHRDEKIIAVSLVVEDESLKKIQNARQEFAKIYEELNLSMEPINERLHITFGYVYAPLDQPNVEEWNQLNNLVETFIGEHLLTPSVYLFDSMTNYTPYHRRKNQVEC